MPIEITGSQISGMDLASASITTEASVVATSSATGTLCISTGAFGVQQGTYYVEVFTPYLLKGTTNLDIELFDGASAAAGTFLQSLTGHMTASSNTLGSGITLVALVTLAAGSHNMTVTGFVDGGTGKFGAGAGTTGAAPPARIRVRST